MNNFYVKIKTFGKEMLSALMPKQPLKKIKFREWEFEVDCELTRYTYSKAVFSGAESCMCNDCKNYVAFRDNVFSDEIKKLFFDLGVDYRKESELCSYEVLPNGLHHVGGWFHFKGRVLCGEDYREPITNGNHSFNLTKITDKFSIGFAEGSHLTYFDTKKDLIQIEFLTYIPWVIDKSLEII